MSGERSVAQDQLTFSIQVLLLKPQQEVILVVPFSLAVPFICLQEQLQRIRSSGMVNMDVCIVWTRGLLLVPTIYIDTGQPKQPQHQEHTNHSYRMLKMPQEQEGL